MPIQSTESVLKFVQSAYQMIDSLNLSMEMLVLIAAIVTIAFLFAMRELAAWFFKIDDLKRDIRSLEVGIERLESEIKSLQAKDGVSLNEPGATPAPHLRRVEQFPINH